MAEMKRPGRWGEDPDSNRPPVRLFSWNWWTVMGLLLLLSCLANRWPFR